MIKDALKYLDPNACVPIDMATTIMLVNALKEALAQRTEQEPTAKYSDIVSDGGLDPRNKFDVSPQRTWVDLTDDEIWEAYMESPLELNCTTDDLYAFSRIIEAKCS